jgi:hypothetical protein
LEANLWTSHHHQCFNRKLSQVKSSRVESENTITQKESTLRMSKNIRPVRSDQNPVLKQEDE